MYILLIRRPKIILDPEPIFDPILKSGCLILV